MLTVRYTSVTISSVKERTKCYIVVAVAWLVNVYWKFIFKRLTVIKVLMIAARFYTPQIHYVVILMYYFL